MYNDNQRERDKYIFNWSLGLGTLNEDTESKSESSPWAFLGSSGSLLEDTSMKVWLGKGHCKYLYIIVFVLILYFVIILELTEVKDNTENPYALHPDFASIKFLYIDGIFVKRKWKWTFQNFYQLNSRLYSDFLRYFPVVLYVCSRIHAGTTQYSIVTCSLSLLTCDYI